MLQIALSLGAEAINSADMRSLAVVNTPSLSAILDVNSAAEKMRSSWLDSTSNWRSSRSITSGNTARATSIFGLFMESPEKDERHHDEKRYQHGARPAHIAKEAGHFDATLFRNRLNHQVGRIADIA